MIDPKLMLAQALAGAVDAASKPPEKPGMLERAASATAAQLPPTETGPLGGALDPNSVVDATYKFLQNQTPLGVPVLGAKAAAGAWNAGSAALAPEVAAAGKVQTRDAPLGLESYKPKVPPPDEGAGGGGKASVSFEGMVRDIPAAQAGYIGDAEQRKYAAMAGAAIDEKEAVEVETANRVAAAQVRKEAFLEETARVAASREAVLAEERSNAESIYRAAVADLQKIDPKIDPNRYWSNKSTEQKIAGGLAAALFGFAGKGMDFLAMVNQEIDRDIEVQKSEFGQKRALASDKVAGAKGSYEMVLEKVKDDRVARETIRTARLNALNQEITTIEAQMKPGLMKANALAAKAEVQKALAESKLKIDQVNASTAIANAQLRQQAAIQSAHMKYTAMTADAKVTEDKRKSIASEQGAIKKHREAIIELTDGIEAVKKQGNWERLYSELPQGVRTAITKVEALKKMAGFPNGAALAEAVEAHQAKMKSMAYTLYHSLAGVLSDAEKKQAEDLYAKQGLLSGVDLRTLEHLLAIARRQHDAAVDSGVYMGTLQASNPRSEVYLKGAGGGSAPPPGGRAVAAGGGEGEGGGEEGAE